MHDAPSLARLRFPLNVLRCMSSGDPECRPQLKRSQCAVGDNSATRRSQPERFNSNSVKANLQYAALSNDYGSPILGGGLMVKDSSAGHWKVEIGYASSTKLSSEFNDPNGFTVPCIMTFRLCLWQSGLQWRRTNAVSTPKRRLSRLGWEPR
jgi:hypothetical protein